MERADGDAQKFGDAQRERVAAAGGELLGAAFKLLGELVAQPAAPPPPENLVASLRSGLEACVDGNGSGPPRLTITLPDRAAIEQLSQSLARLLLVGQQTAAESAPPVPRFETADRTSVAP